jgi:putative transposase
MRYPASEKLEIIRLVENSHLSARRTLQKLGIPRSTFNRWYDRFLAGGVDALEDRKPRPKRVWNRIPDQVRDQIVELALNEPDLSPRELAVTFERPCRMAIRQRHGSHARCTLPLLIAVRSLAGDSGD